MYDYLGYYQICYLGDEVADARADDPPLDPDLGAWPSRLIYLTMNVSILGVLPWREVDRLGARGQRPDAPPPRPARPRGW